MVEGYLSLIQWYASKNANLRDPCDGSSAAGGNHSGRRGQDLASSPVRPALLPVPGPGEAAPPTASSLVQDATTGRSRLARIALAESSASAPGRISRLHGQTRSHSLTSNSAGAGCPEEPKGAAAISGPATGAFQAAGRPGGRARGTGGQIERHRKQFLPTDRKTPSEAGARCAARGEAAAGAVAFLTRQAASNAIVRRACPSRNCRGQNQRSASR